MIDVFTSSAPNYFGKVRLLCESVRRFVPDARIHWLVADDEDDELMKETLDTDLLDDIVYATGLEVGHDRSWLFGHSIVELSTAIKPSAAQRLLEQPDCDAVLYFDPDIVLFSPIEDLIEKLRRSSLVLTPHLLEPETEPAGLSNEFDCLRYGVFNLGFLGVRKCGEGTRFLEWWHNRCRSGCLADWREGMFTDQKWVNLAPVFFEDLAILRNPRFNVAPWNLRQRTLQGSFDEGFKVDGQPLGFYHFTGFDSGAHVEHLASLHRENRSARMLSDWYRWRTGAEDQHTSRRWSLGFYSNGEPIQDEHRRLYRARPDLREAFPDPYRAKTGEESYLDWFRANAQEASCPPL